MTRHQRIAALLAALVVSTATLVVVRSDTPPAVAAPPAMTTRAQPEVRPHVLPISHSADAGKPGELRSVMGQWVLSQDPYTSGPSPDSLRLTFDAPARILGVVISVDISGMPLVEVVAGINSAAPYGIVDEGTAEHRDFVARDWLLHTSDSNDGGPSRIDEQIMFPAGGFAVDAGDYVAVEAWLGNTSAVERGVSPEVIVFYTWADG